MKTTKTQRAIEFFRRMESLGIDYSTAQRLRRIEMTLHRWNELECGAGDDKVTRSIERDEATGKPSMRVQYATAHGWQDRSWPIPDKETGALKRLSAIMANYPALWSHHQTDPRGCALYVGRKSDLRPDESVGGQYYRGIAVCF
jgi:hypothetical protein